MPRNAALLFAVTAGECPQARFDKINRLHCQKTVGNSCITSAMPGLHQYNAADIHFLATDTLTKLPKLAAFLFGALAIPGFAPFYLYPLPVLSLAGLFWLWRNASSWKQATLIGFVFGLGFFGAGISWIYVSLHDFGGMPMPMAALATTGLCAFMALFPAAAGALSVRAGVPRLAAAPLAWVLMEWTHGWIFTGFPWLAVGYSQIPHSPLAGLAPMVGVYGVSLAVAGCAALIVWLAPHKKRLLVALLAVWLAGSALKQIEWSRPLGAPISVSLLQGNIPQDFKWQPEAIRHTLDTYLDLARRYPAQLVVLPETALPLILEQVPPEYLKALAQAGGQDVLVGVVEQEGENYYNSMVSLGAAPRQRYRKEHLVPFGEFIPFKAALGWIYRDWLHIPLADLARGGKQQQPLALAGQRVAVNICYEDAFGEEIIRQLPQATLLVNTSNDAWYGRSLAAHQHLQMSQARALETGRMMLRATNTGATAIIDAQGRLLAEAQHFTTTALTGTAQGYSGITPYVRFGNWPAISLIFLLFALLRLRGRNQR